MSDSGTASELPAAPYAPAADIPCYEATTSHDNINQIPVDWCFSCQRRGIHNGAEPLMPAAYMGPAGWVCLNRL